MREAHGYAVLINYIRSTFWQINNGLIYFGRNT